MRPGRSADDRGGVSLGAVAVGAAGTYNSLIVTAPTNHPVRDAGGRLPTLVDQALGGKDVVITRDDDAAVRLVPVPTPAPGVAAKSLVGAGKGIVLSMADDFDAPLDDFGEYT
jgi:antitoxin (DNA-binding transcriptional repressor) of toxin-antitoxin stability system